jgi:hypothetical protein
MRLNIYKCLYYFFIFNLSLRKFWITVCLHTDSDKEIYQNYQKARKNFIFCVLWDYKLFGKTMTFFPSKFVTWLLSILELSIVTH